MENDFEEKDFGEALTEFCLSMNHNKAKDDVDTSIDVPIELTDLSVRRYETRPIHGGVFVSLYFSGAPKIDCEVEVKCFNDDYLPMGKARVESSGDRRMRLQLKSDYAWLPDVYTFVVYYCSEPIGSYTFSYDGKRFKCIGGGKSVSQSRESVIAEMSINQQSWESLCKTPGVACVIDSAIESAKSGLLRKWRRYKFRAYTPVNRCFIVYDKKFAVPQLLCLHDLGEVDFEKICCSQMTKIEIDDFESTLNN